VKYEVVFSQKGGHRRVDLKNVF